MTTVDRPRIDADALLAWLASLPPAERVTAADVAGVDALALVGTLASVRRAAIVEAHAAGEPLDLGERAIQNAIRTDRELLRAALEILTRDGVSTAAHHELAQGMRPRAPIDAVARRVLFGARHLLAHLNEDDRRVIDAAVSRANEILSSE